MKKLRILIVDDHAIVRAGIRSLLEGEPGIEVAAFSTPRIFQFGWQGFLARC